MPLKKTRTSVEFEVIGEDPMHAVHNPDGAMFIPAWAQVRIENGQTNITIAGPELNKAGKPLKRWTQTGYNQDDLKDGDDNGVPIPQWVLIVLEQYTS